MEAAAYGRAMSDQVSDSISIDAPPAVVFAILAAPRQHSRIDGSGSVQSVIAGPDRISGTGERFVVRMKLFGVPYVIVNRIVEFEPDRLIAWRHFTANRWRYELAPTADGGTTVTETFDMSRADPVTDAVVRWAKFPSATGRGSPAPSSASGRRRRRTRPPSPR